MSTEIERATECVRIILSRKVGYILIMQEFTRDNRLSHFDVSRNVSENTAIQVLEELLSQLKARN